MPRPPIKGLWWKLPLAALVALVVVWLTWLAYLDRQVQHELARIRAEGYPTTLAELDAWYPTPQGPNAADLYLKAFDLLDTDPATVSGALVYDAGLTPGTPLEATVLARSRAALAANADALRLLHEAAALELCRYPRKTQTQHTPGVGALETMPHLGDARSAARMLTMQTLVAVDQHDSIQAARSIAATLALGRSLDQHPFGLLDHLVANSVAVRALETMDQLLAAGITDDVAPAVLQVALRRTVQPESFTRALIAERAECQRVFNDHRLLWFVRNGSAARAWGLPPGVFPVIWRASGVRSIENRNVLLTLRTAIDESRSTHPSATRFAPLASSISARTAPASADWISGFPLTLKHELRTRMMTVTHDAALAVKRFHLATGRWPATLGEVVPAYLDAVPEDLFAPPGTPLRLTTTDTSVIVYSVGADGSDDGGVESTPAAPRYQPGTDITVTLPRHPPSAAPAPSP